MGEPAVDLPVDIERIEKRMPRRRLNGSGDEPPMRSVIQIQAGEQSVAVDEAEAAILAVGAPVFVRAGSLVQPILEETKATGGRSTVVGRIKELCLDSLTDILGQVATFQRYSDQKRRWYKVDPPRWVASILLSRAGKWKLPQLAGVITTPTLRPDGSIFDTPGYDPTTHLYLFLDASFRMPRISERPTRRDAEQALSRLAELLAGFPFVGSVDRAVALSGLLTTVLRPGLPVVPLHAIRAHSAGTGKSFLIDLFATIATGQSCPAMAVGKTEEETEKRLGAMLLDGSPVISIDNVNGELGGDMLCQMTERPLVRIRILGQSKAPEIDCRAMVFANGNNMTLVGDMTRRAVLSSLDAEMERPELRTFAFDPIGRVLEDRGVYVAAILTIIRAYRAAGSPRVCGPIGSYGPWSDSVRSALIWLGEADPVSSMETTRAEDPKLAAQRELFEHWQECFDEGRFYSVTDVINAACEVYPFSDQDQQDVRPLFRELLMRETGSRSARPTPGSLGKWFGSLKGRVVGSFRMDVRHDDKRGNRYALFRVREDAEGSEP